MKIATIHVDPRLDTDRWITDKEFAVSITNLLDEAIEKGCTHYVADVTNDIEGFAMFHMLNHALPVTCVMITPPSPPKGPFDVKYVQFKLGIVRDNEKGSANVVYPYDETPDELHIPDFVLYVMMDTVTLSEKTDAYAVTSKYFNILGYR